MSFAASSTTWIWGYNSKSGSAVHTDDQTITISQHDSGGYGTLLFGSAAKGGSDETPFTQPLGTSAANVASTSTGQNGDDTSSISGSSSGTIITVHGVLAAGVFAVVFPFGGILMRLCSFRGLLWLHGIVQVVGYVLYAVAAGLGIYLISNGGYSVRFDKCSRLRRAPADRQQNFATDKHVIIGYLLLAVLFLQAPLGWLHHVRFVRKGGRTIFSYLHLWIARLAIPIGILNGIFGLKLASSEIWKIVVFGIVGVTSWLLYCAAAIVGERRRTRSLVEKSASHYSLQRDDIPLSARKKESR
jgi:hypothetical protein